MHSKTPISLEKLTRNIKVVPENKKADTMLEEFKNDRSHMAVVIDEYGSVSGLITIEDVLEELVGEIEDEHDTGDVDELIQVSPTEYIADARLDINVFEKKFDLKFDNLDAETVGGLYKYPHPIFNINIARISKIFYFRRISMAATRSNFP